MKSALPKVLHPIGGRPMLGHVLATAKRLEADQRIVVYGHGGEAVRAAFAATPDLIWVEQRERLGTGHAVAQTFPSLQSDGVVLVLYGDAPLIPSATLQPLITSARAGRLGVLTVELDDPTGYGRIVRNAQAGVERIVEHKDATPEQLSLTECNSGILCAPADRLRQWVQALGNDNAQGEYYLTDIIARAVADGVVVEASVATDSTAVQGVNDRVQLAELERHFQRTQAEQLMLSGATLLDPARVDIRGAVTVGEDVTIDVNTVFVGTVHLGDGVTVGSNCVITDAVIGAGSHIHPNSVIEQAEIGEQVSVGPYARLRPGTRLANKARIGNFVETKNAVIGAGSKANHLTYIGDSVVGEGVNIGAGTITANYDGANKHQTTIGDQVSVGSNSVLVAPIEVGRGVTLGAGAVVSKNIPENMLVVTRSPYREIKGWKRPRKKPG